MRQAGRYMQEYQNIRNNYDILEIIKSPNLATEVTLQPIKAYELDAAIIFADILPILETMGLKLEFIENEGPVIHNPIRSLEDAVSLEIPEPINSMEFTLKAIKISRKCLDERGIPLIGFSGAPFTLAYYAVEGRANKNKLKLKSIMYSQPETWHILMSKLAELSGKYLLAQAKAGAQVLQVFDSWAGDLSPQDYREYVKPYTQRVFEIAKAANLPLIHFTTNTNGMLTDIRDAGGDIISVDWRIDIDKAAEILGDNVILQGNLDPAALYAPWPELEKRTRYILDKMMDRKGFIFNLGHGILKTTPTKNVKRMVNFIHEYTSR